MKANNPFDRLNVLRLNKNWQAIGVSSLEKAIGDIFSGSHFGLDVSYEKINGKYDFSNPEYFPLDWEDWLNLEIRDFDFSISSSTISIRVPTIIIAKNYGRMPMVNVTFSRKAIFERDGYICGYSGKKLDRSNATVDHIVPKSKNGSNNWDNLITCDKSINKKKSNRTNEEAGLTLLKKPKKPLPIPAYAKIPVNHDDWRPFLNK